MNKINLIYTENRNTEFIYKMKVEIKSKLDELYKNSEFGYRLSSNCNTNFADCHLGRFADAPYRYYCGDEWFIINSPINLFLIHRYFYHKMKHYGREDKMNEFMAIYSTNEKLFIGELKCGEDENIVINDLLKLTKLIYNDNLTLAIMLHKFKQYDEFICNEGEDGAIMESSYGEALKELGFILTNKESF